MVTAYTGTPHLLVLAKNLGAFPVIASPYKFLLEEYI
jgi:hypothetical protein